MTQGVSGWRNDGLGNGLPLDGGPSSPPATRETRNDLPGYPDPVLMPPLPRTALAPATVTPTSQAARDALVQTRLDAFRAAMNAPYHTREGVAWPGTTFRMLPGYDVQQTTVAKNADVIGAAATKANVKYAVGMILIGRGSPEEIHALTQALIDLGSLPPPSTGDLETRVRVMMFNHGIGIDCAGYVQQAYLRATGLSPAAAHFNDRSREDLSRLPDGGYTRVTDLAAVRPGDLVALGPPGDQQPGHRAIVYEQHLASGDELDELRSTGDAGRRMAQSGPVRVFQVDSSWGCGGDPRLGGVRRETWWHSEKSGAWGWMQQGADGSASFRAGPTPYAHPFSGRSGIFRARATP